MKKFVMIVSALACTLTLAVAEGDYPESVSGMRVLRQDESSYKLIYKSVEKSDVKVQIFNEKNALVFTETIRHSDGFSRPYNFASLPEGSYTIKLDNGSNWLTETVDYKFGRSEKLAQLIKLGNGKYLLTVPGKGRDNVSITVYNAEGTAIHRGNHNVSGDFSQVFDLSAVEGSFSLEVGDASGASKMFRR